MLRHQLAGPALALHRAARMFRPPAAGFRILLFHHVPRQRFDAFERLIIHVKQDHGVLSPGDAEARLAGETAGDNAKRTPCLISFDDGFKSNYDLAESVLAAHDVKALFFVCPGLLELPVDEQPGAIAANVFDGRLGAAELDPALDLMTWDQVLDLHARGHAVGCHGMDHQRLSAVETTGLETQVTAAGDMLEARMGSSTPWFAYAFGDIGSISGTALDVIGRRFPYCRSGVRGLNDAETPRLGLLADEIDVAAPLTYQKLVLEGGLDGRYQSARRQLHSYAREAA